jgi:hypothetical protein
MSGNCELSEGAPSNDPDDADWVWQAADLTGRLSRRAAAA